MPHLVKKGFLTTCLTTDSFGTHGNSGVKRCGEYAETSRNYRKWPEMYRKNLVQPFGRIRPGHPTTSYPGVAQLVARLLWEQDAAGSNPVTRTTFVGKTAYLGGFSAFLV